MGVRSEPVGVARVGTSEARGGSWPDGWPGAQLDALLQSFLAEDIGSGDITSEVCLPPGLRARGELVAKQAGVVVGLAVARRVFALVDPDTVWIDRAADGVRVPGRPHRVLAEVRGTARALLRAERVALNLVQRLSGVATATARAVAAAGVVQVLDTRKTTPGLRWLEKYAVRVAGGRNHRFGLDDGILIKDNHIRAAGGVAVAVGRARAQGPQGLRIEVECTTLDEVDTAVAAGAEIVLLDNMDPGLLRQAVLRIAGRVRVEASGGITPDNLAEVAACGVDAVSLGALTHSAPALDLSLEIEPLEDL